MFPLRIYTALKLLKCLLCFFGSLFPLRIYTALKLSLFYHNPIYRLFPLRIYTALKLQKRSVAPVEGLFPLRIYTALKLFILFSYLRFCLFPLRIYTALKLENQDALKDAVCFPYEFTLLSNSYSNCLLKNLFVSPTNLHCSQTHRLLLAVRVGLFPLRIYTALKPQIIQE